MTKTRALIWTGLVTLTLIVGLYVWKSQVRSEENMSAAVEPEKSDETPDPTANGEAAPSTETSGFLPTQMENADLFQSLQKMVQDMNKCLGTQVAAIDRNAEFNLEMFSNMITPFMGDPVMTTNEWTATDIQTPSGELRRIMIEYKTDIMSDSGSALKYYSVGTQGELKEIPLAEDQSTDPSETLIASLEADGSVVSKSRSQRAFFQNGGNVLIVEQNGKLVSFDIPSNGKRFRCEALNSAEKSHCECL